VYLAARARIPGMKREALDDATARLDLRVVPAARGCIYLVPRVHAALALRHASSLWRGRAERDIARAGGTWRQVEDIARAIAGALARPMTTDAIRRALPERTVPSYGERGKKVGTSSPLPVALRLLEFDGTIERTLDGGRLDTERYVWRTAKESIFAGANVLSGDRERAVLLAQVFFAQTGPSTVKQFADFMGLSVRDATEAVMDAELARVAVDEFAEEAWLPAKELAALEDAHLGDDTVRFLPVEDLYVTVHGPGAVTPAKHHGRSVGSWGTTARAKLGEAKHLDQRVVLVGPTIAGFWEYDAEEAEVVFAPLAPLTSHAKSAVQLGAEETARFIQEELGHARTFSLDTDDAVQARARSLRKAATKA
jgi:hypothetical protein